MINFINEETYKIYNRTSASVMSSRDGFVCLNPWAKQYGGFGNLLYYAVVLVELGLALGRVPVMNHALVTGLFDHPDDRQTWKLFTPDDIFGMKDRFQEPIRCNGIEKMSLQSSFSSRFGIHGCPNNYANNIQMQEFFKKLISWDVSSYRQIKFMPTSEWLLHSVMMPWLLSRPTRDWARAVDKYKASIFGSPNITIDVAIQFRQYVDLPGKTDFHLSGGDCTVQCARDLLSKLSAKKQKSNHDSSSAATRDINVFLTSDNTTSMMKVIEQLKLWWNSTSTSNPANAPKTTTSTSTRGSLSLFFNAKQGGHTWGQTNGLRCIQGCQDSRVGRGLVLGWRSSSAMCEWM
jgi:hypothetical protein